MHLPLGSHGRETQQQQEAREARRLFRESTRTDWHFPPLPAYRAITSGAPPKSEGTIAGFQIHAGAKNLVDQIIPQIADWHEREYGSSDSDYDGETDGSLAGERARALKKEDYIFDSPDNVKEELLSRKQTYKVKKQRMLAEEMDWNVGLAHFIARRDLWTGAKSTTEVDVIKSSATATPEAISSPAASSPRSSTSVATDGTEPSRPSTAMTSPDPAAGPTMQPLAPDMLIPRMTKVLAQHPIRRKIGPSMYSEIYSKIISQSRTPAVPINLLHLTRALVAGWKADGEWPPKPSAPEPSVGRRKTGLREGVKAAARVLKISSSDVVAPKDDKKKAG